MNVSTLVEDSLLQLLFTEPMLAHFISRIGYTIVEDKDKNFTAWTDGKTITVNAHAVNEINNTMSMNKQYMAFILAHEAMHLLTLTWDRGKQINITNHKKWNIATDYEINSILVKDHIGLLPSFALYKECYKNKTAEEIYNLLSGDESENGQNFELDDHLEVIEDITKEKIKQCIKEITDNSLFSLQSSNLINRLNETILKPEEFNWRKALNKYFKSFIKCNYSWNKPNRSGIYRNLILPSTSTTPTIKIAVAIDTSGSVSSKELNVLLNHILTIMSQFKTFTLDMWCFSTTVHKETFKTYTEKHKDISNFRLASFGGTNISSNFKFIKEHYKNNKPDVFLVFSDFKDTLHNNNTITFDYCPCIWLVINNKKFIKPSRIKAERFDYITDK